MQRSLVNLFCLFLATSLVACVPYGDGERRNIPPPKVSTTPPAEAQAPGEASLTGPRVMPEVNQSVKDFPNRIPPGTPQVKIAILLPMTGESADLGQSMLDAANLALYDQYFPLKSSEIRANVVLLPKDTAASPTMTANAAQQSIDQEAALIVGPVFSSTVGAAAPIARKAGVPMLALSNNRAIAGNGVFVYGFLPEQQASRIAEYAALKGITAVGSMAPNDAYGNTVDEALKNTLSPRGIRVSSQLYARTQANLDAASQRLMKTHSEQPFQGLFIADGGEQLKQVLKSLKTSGLERSSVRLLGTGLWDEEDVRMNPDMAGAWFASAPAQYYTAFERRFKAAYGYKPKRLASLTYDAVSLAASIALTTGQTNFSLSDLTQPTGFIGPANGLYRLNGDGTNDRALSVMEVNPAGFKTLDAAPKSF